VELVFTDPLAPAQPGENGESSTKPLAAAGEQQPPPQTRLGTLPPGLALPTAAPGAEKRTRSSPSRKKRNRERAQRRRRRRRQRPAKTAAQPGDMRPAETTTTTGAENRPASRPAARDASPLLQVTSFAGATIPTTSRDDGPPRDESVPTPRKRARECPDPALGLTTLAVFTTVDPFLLNDDRTDGGSDCSGEPSGSPSSKRRVAGQSGARSLLQLAASALVSFARRHGRVQDPG
jgi:hypothetical protein